MIERMSLAILLVFAIIMFAIAAIAFWLVAQFPLLIVASSTVLLLPIIIMAMKMGERLAQSYRTTGKRKSDH